MWRWPHGREKHFCDNFVIQFRRVYYSHSFFLYIIRLFFLFIFSSFFESFSHNILARNQHFFHVEIMWNFSIGHFHRISGELISSEVRSVKGVLFRGHIIQTLRSVGEKYRVSMVMVVCVSKVVHRCENRTGVFCTFMVVNVFPTLKVKSSEPQYNIDSFTFINTAGGKTHGTSRRRHQQEIRQAKSCLVSYWWRRLEVPCVLSPAVHLIPVDDQRQAGEVEENVLVRWTFDAKDFSLQWIDW